MPAAPPTDRVPDDELLSQAAAGDARAFAELFRRRHPDVFRFALHLTGSVATAEDVVQDVFMVVVRDGARYDAGRATVAAWLCGIARNLVRQRLERDRRLTSVDFADDGEPSAVDNGGVDPLAGLLRAERVETLRRAVQALPLPYREAVVLCDLQEMSYEEAAGALGCPVGTVRSRLHRARTMLAARLAVSALAPAASAAGARAGPPALEVGWAGQAGATNTVRG
jgi:RNA polymerase sigma-70 factor (ECF subfamily)